MRVLSKKTYIWSLFYLGIWLPLLEAGLPLLTLCPLQKWVDVQTPMCMKYCSLLFHIFKRAKLFHRKGSGSIGGERRGIVACISVVFRGWHQDQSMYRASLPSFENSVSATGNEGHWAFLFFLFYFLSDCEDVWQRQKKGVRVWKLSEVKHQKCSLFITMKAVWWF